MRQGRIGGGWVKDREAGKGLRLWQDGREAGLSRGGWG